MAASPSHKAARSVLPLLLAATVLIFLLHVGYGSSSFLSPARVVAELLHGPTGATNENNVVWLVRLTRGLGCLLVGGILGVVGSAFQALFRNPLAEPYVVGVSSGAAVGSVVASLGGFAGLLGGLGQDFAAFIGGMLSLGLVLSLAGRKGTTSVTTLLIAGVVVGSMLSAVLSLCMLASGHDANELMLMLMGNTSAITWSGIDLLAVAFFVGTAVLMLQARSLNAFAIGEETAKRLGVNTSGLKLVVLIVGTAMVGVAVGSAGIIGFLGLVAPHIARGLVGIDWRRSLAVSAVVGAGLLVIADVLTQRVIPEVTTRFGFHPVIDLPVGAVTALIGAPSLLILLRRSR